MAHIDAAAEKCGYSTYSAIHATFPPSGLLSLPGNSTEAVPGCSLWEEIFDAALLVNPAFNIYRIFDTVRSLFNSSNSDVLILFSFRFCGTFSVFRMCYIHVPLQFPLTDVLPTGGLSNRRRLRPSISIATMSNRPFMHL